MPYIMNYRERVLNTAVANLLAYWPMHGGSPVDMSGNGRDCGVTAAPVRSTETMDGIDAPLFIAGNAQSVLNMWTGVSAVFDKTNGSMVAWAKANQQNVVTNSNHIFRFGGLTIALRQAGIGWYYFECGNKSASYTIPNRIYDWHCLGVSWSSTVGTAVAKLYCDGVLVSTSSAGYTASGTPDKGYIGADNSTFNRWNGWIKHVALWNAQLTDEEMISLTRWQ